MEVLRAAVASAVGGQGRLVMLAGEPGIGKTRLAQEFANDTAEQGVAVRWGRCWEGEGAPGFWPWIQILRAQIAETEPDELQRQLGAGVGDLARLVPDLQQHLPGMVAGGPLEDDVGARFRLFDRVGRFLRAGGTRQPQALILEDLHWADAASLDLLRFIADAIQDSHLLLIGTYRDVETTPPHPLSKILGALAYHPVVQHVQLEGLTEEEVGALIESLGCERSASLVGLVHRQSGGNPFFAAAIARATAGGTTPPAVVPGGVRDAIGNRLERLSSECAFLLQIACVIGPEFDLGTLERVVANRRATAEETDAVCGTPVVRLLSEALEARVVDEVEGVSGGYRFAHALIREVLYKGLSLEERLGLHWEIGTALETLGAREREHGADALAHHFLEAIAGRAEGTPRQECIDNAVRYATRAAGRATAMVAYEEAAAHCERAVRALQAWAPTETERQYELLLAEGGAQSRAGTAYSIRSETYHRAAALARERGEPERLARAALSLGRWTRTVEAANDAYVALLCEALDAVGPGDSSERAQLLGYLAVAKYFPDPRVHSAPLSAEALAMARRVNDPRTLGVALLPRYVTLTEPERTEERLQLAEEIIALGEQLGDRELAMEGRAYRLWERLAQGEIAILESELAQFETLADDLRQPYFQFRAASMRAALALLAGRFAEAERLTFAARRLMQQRDDQLVIGALLEQLYTNYCQQERLDEIEELVKGVTSSARAGWSRSIGIVPAHCHAELGRMDEARAALEQVFGDDVGAMPRLRIWSVTMLLLADLLEMLDDDEHAAALYPVLLPYAHRLTADSTGPLCSGSFSFPLGQLASVMGRWDDALRHFDDALVAAVEIGSPPWGAYAQYGTAKVLLARGHSEDRQHAGALLAQVLQTADALDMPRLRRRVRKLQEQFNVEAAGEPDTDAPPLEKGGKGGFLSRPVGEIPLSPSSSKGEVAVTATLRQEGDYWVAGYEPATFRLKDRLGLHYLLALLRKPEHEFLAIDLVAAVQGTPRRSGSENDMKGAFLGGAEPYFDMEARAAYERRLRDLRATLEEAEEFNDLDRASRTRAEIEFLADELHRGLGLGHQIRASGSPLERARVSVTLALKGAVRAIRKNDERLGHYLATTIKTGTYCSYNAGPEPAVTWRL